MPRKAPLPVEERSVGVRVRFLRELLGVKRTALALAAKIGTERLASYESGRSPVPVEIGERICGILNASQLWAALGEGDMGGHRKWSPRNRETTFREAVMLQAAELRAIKPANTSWGAGGETPESLIMALSSEHSHFVRHVMPPTLYQTYFRHIATAQSEFLTRHRDAFDLWAVAQLKSVNAATSRKRRERETESAETEKT